MKSSSPHIDSLIKKIAKVNHKEHRVSDQAQKMYSMYFQIKFAKNQQNTKHRKYKPDRGGHKIDRKQSKYCLS